MLYRFIASHCFNFGGDLTSRRCQAVSRDECIVLLNDATCNAMALLKKYHDMEGRPLAALGSSGRGNF